MLRALAEIGEAFREQNPLTQTPNVNKEIAIDFSQSGEEVAFDTVRLLDADTGRPYLYIETKGQRGLISPTVMVSGLKGPKRGKDPSELVKLKAYFEKRRTREDTLGKIANAFLGSYEKIKERCIQEAGRLKGRDRALLTIRLVKDGKTLYPGDIGEIPRDVEDAFCTERLGKRKKGNGTCSICGRMGEVFSAASEAFKFSTFDKPGFAPGVCKDLSWAAFPICKSCLWKILTARRVIEEKLQFPFVRFTRTNIQVWVIPSPTKGGSPELLRDVVETLSRSLEEFRGPKGALQADGFPEVERLATKKTAVDELEDILSGERDTKTLLDQVNYTFVFLRRQQQEEKILLSVEDIPPSHLSKLAFLKANLYREYKHLLPQRPKGGFLSFLHIKDLVAGADFQSQRFYLSLVGALLSSRCVDPLQVIRFANVRIRDLARNLENQGNQSFSETVICAFALVELVKEAPTFQLEGGWEMFEETIDRNALDRILSKEFFRNASLKASFLTGALVGKLLRYQRDLRGSSPFFKKLKGLKLSFDDVKTLFKDALAKLEEYEYHSSPIAATVDALKEKAAESFVEVLSPSTSEEVSFAFSLGLALSEKIRITRG